MIELTQKEFTELITKCTTFQILTFVFGCLVVLLAFLFVFFAIRGDFS